MRINRTSNIRGQSLLPERDRVVDQVKAVDDVAPDQDSLHSSGDNVLMHRLRQLEKELDEQIKNTAERRAQEWREQTIAEQDLGQAHHIAPSNDARRAAQTYLKAMQLK